MRLKLNGVELGALELPVEPAEERLAAPAAAWREGKNLLELAVDSLALAGGGARRGFGLSRVTYDQPLRVRVRTDSRRLELDPGTAADYGLEPLVRSRLHLRGRARGRGELRLYFLRADRARGEPEVEVSCDPIALEGGEVERALPLPDVGGDLLRLRIYWTGEARSTLALTELRLEELEPAARFPIVLIAIDTLSARHLSLYGYPLQTTPALERFASGAIVFERCLANAPWTLPSFMSLVSGLHPGAHRLRNEPGENELWEQWHLAANRWTLPEFLRAAGWRTEGIVDNFWITERFGFPQGFERYDSSAGENEKTDPDGGIRQVLAQARSFLEDLEPGEAPFLLLHAFDAHGPYSPPRPFRGSFPADAAPYDLAHTAPAGGPSDAYGIIASYIARGEASEGAVPPVMRAAPLARLYDEGIAMIDAELGLFLEWMADRGILERSLVVVTADHGEAIAGERYLFGHGVLDEDVLRVPLIVRLPGGRGGGRRIAEPVQLLDLYPTLLDLLGSRASREHLHGRSLVPLLEGGTRPASPVLCEGGNMRQSALYAGDWKLVERDLRDAPLSVLLSYQPLTPEWLEAAEERLRREKLVEESAFAWRADEALVNDLFERLPRSGLTEELLAEMRSRSGFESLIGFLRKALAGPRVELYDLASDPRASRDLHAERPGKVAELTKLMRAEQERRETARAAARLPTQAVELSTEDLEALRALGYAGKQ